MIIALDAYGRLGNRLVYFAYTCATALISHQRYLNLMSDVVQDFAELSPSVMRKYRVRCVARVPGWSAALRLREAWRERICEPAVGRYLAGNELRAQKMRLKTIMPKLILSWWYRDHEALVAMRGRICELLKPKSRFVRPAESFVSILRHDCAALVGVHVRRGDYRTFAEGQFFFSDEEYLRFMRDVKMSTSEKIKFVIVSNEEVDVHFFKENGLDVAYFKGDDFREELVLLSLCDYVMGPVSTFSWWAAYYGGARYCAIKDRSQSLGISSFLHVKGGEFELEHGC